MKTYLNVLAAVVSAGFITACSQPQETTDGIQREKLGRGLVAVRQNADEVALSWRYLSTDPMNTTFNVYRDGTLIAEVAADKGTFFNDSVGASIPSTCRDGALPPSDHCRSRIAQPPVGADRVSARNGNADITYKVVPVVDGKENINSAGIYTLPADAPYGYINIPLDIPADGTTPAGDIYSYAPNDASIGDVDGDGNYEIILKWDPSNAHDNAHDGYTGNVCFDCYKLTGEKLWRIDMGRNIRAGAHYTQFMVYDLDGDGKAEIVMKTSDGTVDGRGNTIGDASADYREHGDPDAPRGGDFHPNDPRAKGRPGDPPRNQGRILTGNEYLTVFNGETGEAMKTIDYVPPRGNLMDWGDDRANRSDRFLACVAYLDGKKPSVVMCRGYYTRAVLAAFDWDGKELTQRWVFDSNNEGCEDYAGQGNHNLRVGDVDGDGCDEIVYGQCTIDHDGTGLYSTKMGHGDAMHMTGFIPGSDALQVWSCHENRRDGSSFRDARTGEVLFQIKNDTDVGRCMAADIDPTNEGVEMWSLASGGIRNIKGEVVNADPEGISYNMAVWWDGDLLRELLDKNYISKYNWETGVCDTLLVFEGAVSNSGTKATPCIQGDIVGDWREEVLLRTEDNSELHLYVSGIPTGYRFHTFLEDRVYRISLVTQNVAYNQPTQPGFYFGPDLKNTTFRGYKF